MKSLPDQVRSYKRTATFTEKTVPKGLLKDHQTRAGTWGKICVLAGQVRYVIDGDAPEVILLQEGDFGIVEPEVVHHLELVGTVELFVEFYQ